MKRMAILWTTAALAEWEEELLVLDPELDREYLLEQSEALEDFNNESFVFDQTEDLWDDMALVERFYRFYYKHPYQDYWDNPHFLLDDPLGLFTNIVDHRTFLILQNKIFKIEETYYRPSGRTSFKLDEIRKLFKFAERYTSIKRKFEGEDMKRKKFVVWVVSRMMEFLV